MENKANRIYDKGTRQWFDVSPDAYEAYDRERTAFRKKMQHQGSAAAPATSGGCATLRACTVTTAATELSP